MEGNPRYLQLAGSFVHKHFLILLLAAYAAASLWPWLGLAAREITIARFDVIHETVSLTLPMILLAGLLCNGGLSANASELAQVVRKPQIVLAGLLMNLLV